MTHSCPWGYTESDLHALLGDRLPEFNRWMSGQTTVLCEGRKYDYTRKAYVPDECAGNPHGGVAYAWDVERFLRRLPVID